MAYVRERRRRAAITPESPRPPGDLSGIRVRDWDVGSAYFTFDRQDVLKLSIENECRHFRLETVRYYIDNKESIWESMKAEYSDGKGRENYIKNVITSVFHGSFIPVGDAKKRVFTWDIEGGPLHAMGRDFRTSRNLRFDVIR